MSFPKTLEEQTTLTALDTDIQTLKQRLEKTQAIKKGMMQQLLTGKTRLNSSQIGKNRNGLARDTGNKLLCLHSQINLGTS
jgi:restriction endonuclease S subunit